MAQATGREVWRTSGTRCVGAVRWNPDHQRAEFWRWSTQQWERSGWSEQRVAALPRRAPRGGCADVQVAYADTWMEPSELTHGLEWDR